jgi:putative membrane protein
MKLHKQATLMSIAGLALALSGSTSFGADNLFGSDKDQRGQLSERDYKFVKEAARGGMSEVELGQLAKQKGASQSVKDFGERMVKDHSKANDELKSIASSKGATIPADLTRTEKSTMEKLQKANGAEFDREYAAAMVKDHRTDVKAFKDAGEDLKDPELKAFAQKTTPTLEEHLRMAEDMERNVRAVSPTGR